MFTHLHVTGHSTIRYHRFERDYLRIAKMWIIAFMALRTVPLSYDLNDCTSHIVAVCNFNVTAWFLIKVKVYLTRLEG